MKPYISEYRQLESRYCELFMSLKIILHKYISTFEQLVIIGYMFVPGLCVVQTVLFSLGRSSHLLPLRMTYEYFFHKMQKNSPVRM
jgi:hypothetical protein